MASDSRTDVLRANFVTLRWAILSNPWRRAASLDVVSSTLTLKAAFLRSWRNWQTHQLEGLAPARAWRFKPSRPHSFSMAHTRKRRESRRMQAVTADTGRTAASKKARAMLYASHDVNNKIAR